MTMLKASTDSSTTVTVAAYAAFGSDAGAGAGSLAGAKSPGKDGGRALHSVTAAAPRLQQWPRQRRQRQQQQQQQQQQPSNHLERFDQTTAVACRGESLKDLPSSRAIGGTKQPQQQQQQQQPSNHMERFDQTTAVACRGESLNDLTSSRAIGAYQPERISPSEIGYNKNRGRSGHSPVNSDRPPPPMPRGPSSAKRGNGNCGFTDGSDRNSIDARSLAGGMRHNGEPGGGGGNSRGCLLYTSPSPRDKRQSRMPSSA